MDNQTEIEKRKAKKAEYDRIKKIKKTSKYEITIKSDEYSKGLFYTNGYDWGDRVQFVCLETLDPIIVWKGNVFFIRKINRKVKK